MDRGEEVRRGSIIRIHVAIKMFGGGEAMDKFHIPYFVFFFFFSEMEVRNHRMGW